VEDSERRATIIRHLGVGNERIVALDHHACHAAAAYFGSPFGGAPALVLTNDNSGDGLCATVSTAEAATLTRREATPSANPSDHRVVTIINTMIKNRDFWMPFAPSILREREADYVVNPKGLSSPYMMLAFPTNPARRQQIVAAVHPQDGTARAHLVDEAWNPAYHRLIREFESRTGIGAVLNTSFNLHGEPLVCSPDDAIDTFERSGLPHLALGRWIISKQ
jgi:predicted NodU family carbamoyl transferase